MNIDSEPAKTETAIMPAAETSPYSSQLTQLNLFEPDPNAPRYGLNSGHTIGNCTGDGG